MAQHIGEIIKEHRDAKGWSPEKLASESLLSRARIDQIEKSGVAPVETLKRIANALEVRLSEMIAETELVA